MNDKEVFEKIRVDILKMKLEEKEIEYIEDDIRILISLDKLEEVEEIISSLPIKVLDEVINDEYYGGDQKHYYLIAKSENTPIIEYINIKNRIGVHRFKNTVYLKYGYDIMSEEDGSGYASARYVRQCLQSPNIRFRDTVDCIDKYTEVKITNAILL